MTLKVAPVTPAERRRSLFVLLAAVLLTVPFHYVFGCMVHYVHGLSMYPTLDTDRTVVVLWPWGSVERGDVVVLEHEGEKRWCKRVVGIPGDRIVIEPGTGPIFVNGEPLDEPYLDRTLVLYRKHFDVTLGEDEYYVLGDNRRDSYDSRFVGPILASEILVTFDLWFQL